MQGPFPRPPLLPTRHGYTDIQRTLPCVAWRQHGEEMALGGPMASILMALINSGLIAMTWEDTNGGLLATPPMYLFQHSWRACHSSDTVYMLP